MKLFMVLSTIALSAAELSIAAKVSSMNLSTPKSEKAMSMRATDSNLKWGPGPQFMPEGISMAILHGDPAKKNTDAFLKIPSRAKIPNHYHTSAERMILVSGDLNIKYEGHMPISMKAGAYAYGPAKLEHEAECVSKTPCILFIAFEEPIDAIQVNRVSKK